MPELSPTGAVDVVERQVRRVRRRKNLYELQRTLYTTVAAGAGAATLLLPVTLFASTTAFGLAAACMAALMLGVAMLLAGALRRRWLGRAHAVRWVEAKAALGGRVQTLVEIAPRARNAPQFFQALLASQVAAELDAWRPQRLVPRAVPRAAGASAVVMVAVLIVVFHLASLALPTPPAIGFSDRPHGGRDERSDGGDGAAPGERVVVAPGVPSTGDTDSGQATDDGRDDDSRLTQLSSAVQENVRKQVWGKAWERVRDALARAGTSGGGSRRDGRAASEDGGEEGVEGKLEGTEENEWEVARRPSERARGAADSSSDHTDGTDGADGQGDANSNADDPSAGSSDDADAGDAGGTTAGNGASPGDLFAGAPVMPGAGSGSFELSLAARMRSDRSGRKRSGGPAPDADPDARPALGTEQRRETAAHRMAVPAAYEQVVREVFAHRGTP